MRNNIFLYIVICGLSLLTACDKDDYKDEQGVVIELNMPSEDQTEDIDVRVFGSDGILANHYDFASGEELGSRLLPLSSGDYTIVATSNTNAHFSHSQQIGKTTLAELLLTMNEPYSAQSHSHYGVAEVAVVGERYTNVTVDANRIFAEVAVSMKNLHEDIVAVEMIIKNSAKGLYPAVHKLTNEYNSTHLGKISAEGNRVKFPVLTIMPSVSMLPKSRATSTTLTEFVFHYKNGDKVAMEATLPIMENGGTYTPELDFKIFKKDIIINITDIIGWGDGEDHEGEILNPINEQRAIKTKL